MKTHARLTTIAVTASLLSACASVPKTATAAFTVRTTPAGASVETTQGFRCTTPCAVPLGPTAFVTTVSLLGYKPVQIPVASAHNPGTIEVKLVPQDPGAGAPNPVAGK